MKTDAAPQLSPALFSSKKMDWRTPPEVFEPLNKEFKFTLDVACTTKNKLVERGLTVDTGYDALTMPWSAYPMQNEPVVAWCNPPYGREIGKWVQKAWDEKRRGVTTVMLVPARTDTRWWGIFWNHTLHRTRDPRDEVRFVQGRIKFLGIDEETETCVTRTPVAPFPSAIVVLRGTEIRLL